MRVQCTIGCWRGEYLFVVTVVIVNVCILAKYIRTTTTKIGDKIQFTFCVTVVCSRRSIGLLNVKEDFRLFVGVHYFLDVRIIVVNRCSQAIVRDLVWSLVRVRTSEAKDSVRLQQVLLENRKRITPILYTKSID